MDHPCKSLLLIYFRNHRAKIFRRSVMSALSYLSVGTIFPRRMSSSSPTAKRRFRSGVPLSAPGPMDKPMRLPRGNSSMRPRCGTSTHSNHTVQMECGYMTSDTRPTAKLSFRRDTQKLVPLKYSLLDCIIVHFDERASSSDLLFSVYS